MVAGIGVSVISLWIVYKYGTYVSFKYPYWLTGSSMIDEMMAGLQSELQFNLSLLSVAIFISVVLVSILGGYIGGKVAYRNEMEYGLLIGLALR